MFENFYRKSSACRSCARGKMCLCLCSLVPIIYLPCHRKSSGTMMFIQIRNVLMPLQSSPNYLSPMSSECDNDVYYFIFWFFHSIFRSNVDLNQKFLEGTHFPLDLESGPLDTVVKSHTTTCAIMTSQSLPLLSVRASTCVAQRACVGGVSQG